MSVVDERMSARFSNMGEFTLPTGELYLSILKLVRLNTGDQTARMQNTHDFMVKQSKWLTESQFNEIYHLCHNLPGPTTTQVIITIISLKLKSISTAITCFLIYNSIPWILLTLLGFISSYFLKAIDKEYELSVQMVIMGCTAAGAGIMVRSLYQYATTLSDNLVKILLMLISATIFYIYKSKNAIIFCLTLGAIVSLYLDQGVTPKKMSSKSMNLFSSIKFNFLLGKPSIIMLISIFFILWVFFSIFHFKELQYVFSFYWIGCFILGPI